MRITQLSESGRGTFVGINLTDESNARLSGWMAQNLITDPEPAANLHCTLILSKDRKIPYHPIRYDPPVMIDPESYSIDLFGDDHNVMVLSFRSPVLERWHMRLRTRYGLTWDYPDYRPHITLTNTVQEIATELEVPDFALEFDTEYVEAFD